MNNSITYSQEASAVKQDVCSEKKCITCFENRGCIYEQYVMAVMHSIEESYQAQQKNEDRDTPIWKQEDRNIINYSSQKGLTA